MLNNPKHFFRWKKLEKSKIKHTKMLTCINDKRKNNGGQNNTEEKINKCYITLSTFRSAGKATLDKTLQCKARHTCKKIKFTEIQLEFINQACNYGTRTQK